MVRVLVMALLMAACGSLPSLVPERTEPFELTTVVMASEPEEAAVGQRCAKAVRRAARATSDATIVEALDRALVRCDSMDEFAEALLRKGAQGPEGLLLDSWVAERCRDASKRVTGSDICLEMTG